MDLSEMKPKYENIDGMKLNKEKKAKNAGITPTQYDHSAKFKDTIKRPTRPIPKNINSPLNASTKLDGGFNLYSGFSVRISIKVS